MHEIRFDIQIVDGAVGGTGWSDRLTKGGLTHGGMSVVLSACVAVLLLAIFGPARTHPGIPLHDKTHVCLLTWASGFGPHHSLDPSPSFALLIYRLKCDPGVPSPFALVDDIDTARGTPINYVSHESN